MKPNTLVLTSAEFSHLKEKSSYNHNFYTHSKLNYKILEECDDDSTFFFYLCEHDKEIFIGCSKDGFGEGKEVVIDFKFYHD